jgi:hypothetical protein
MESRLKGNGPVSSVKFSRFSLILYETLLLVLAIGIGILYYISIASFNITIGHIEELVSRTYFVTLI